MSLDQPEENELLDRIAREDFADEWTEETHEDPYIDHGSPVGRILTLCEIDGHTFGVIYRPDQGRFTRRRAASYPRARAIARVLRERFGADEVIFEGARDAGSDRKRRHNWERCEVEA